jgi:hypothetical protein
MGVCGRGKWRQKDAGLAGPHSDKRYGIIDVPVFEIVGWGEAADVEDATDTTVEEAEADAGESEEEVKTRPATKKAAATKKPAPVKKPAPGKKKIRF